jgi:hypothetical protein
MKNNIKKYEKNLPVSFLCASAIFLAGTVFILSACAAALGSPSNTSQVGPEIPDDGTRPVSWFVSDTDDPMENPAVSPVEHKTRSVKEALAQIRTAYRNGTFAENKKAVIVIDGIITAKTEGALSNNSLVSITESGAYPPLVLRGSNSGGTLDGENQVRVLYAANNKLTIADGLTLTRGNTKAHNETYGGGVFIEKTNLSMTGGMISDCTAEIGSGVHIYEDKEGKHSTFEMSGGTIKGGSSPAVYVDRSCTFVLSGSGLITENGLDGSTDHGGGVEIDGYGVFTMFGGEISGNMASKYGGGVSVNGFGIFAMFGGTITKNIAPDNSGSGVFVSKYSAVFNHSGGSISGNYGNPDIAS